ncbi:SurA N-terminal domain-containing protein [Motiliproteus sediminis]|uniref:SurA N-terminal domain-containing protein n=1 Tax=Motiliproteus sediminis TaxID=1468178 RepID=UPI001AF02024|nr:SurA N-terminal domain-containing protein [Motiliproteus sediminis]
MLQNLRENSQGIIAKVIVGFIIITFALWGVDSLVGLATDSGAPVTVNGVEVSEQQIQQGIELQRRQILAQMGENADPSLLDDKLLREAVVERLVEETLLIESARDQGMTVGTEYLDKIILATREFQVDGQFDRNQFDAMLRNAGLSPMMYRDLLRREMLINQRQSGVVATAFAVPSELQALRALDRQVRSMAYTELSVDNVLATIAVDDAEVEDYYRQQQSRFVTDEEVVVDYLSLDLDSLAAQVEVTDTELKAAFDQLIQDFQGDEARDASHILIAVGTERDAEAAKALAEEVKAKLDAGESFAALAETYSDDTGSAETGGELGLVEKEVMVPEFEQALFELAEGEVSSPVETDFGFHLIKLNSIVRSEAPTFEQARSGLEAELRNRKADDLFVAKIEELADVSFSAADLQEPAEALGLPVQTAEPIGRDGGSSLLASHPRVIDAAFSDDVLKHGHNSPVIELSPQRSVVIRLNEYRPSRQRPLDEVRDQVVAELKQQKASAEVRERAEAIAKQVSDGNESGLAWTTQERVQRGDQTLPAGVVRELFRMPKPEGDEPSVTIVELADGSAAVIKLTAVSDGDLASLSEQEARMLGGFLANRHGQYDYRGVVRHLRDSAEVERL